MFFKEKMRFFIMQLIRGKNDLRTLHPELAGEWHRNKNKELKPDDVTCGSSRTVWWL